VQLGIYVNVSAQSPKLLVDPNKSSINSIHSSTKINDSTFLQIAFLKGPCKFWKLDVQTKSISKPLMIDKPIVMPSRAKTNLIHGDISYDFFYRSDIDTPYADNNIQQHNIRANIQILIAKQLPVTLQVNTRQTNSYLFKNYTDLNFQFNGQQYKSNLKEQLTQQITQQINANSTDNLVYAAMQKQQQLQNDARSWLEDGKQLQRLVESRQVVSGQVSDFSNEQGAMGNVQSAISNVRSTIGGGQFKIYNAQSAISNRQFAIGSAIKQTLENNKEYQQQRLMDSVSNQKEKTAAFLEKYEAKEAEYKKITEKLNQLQQQYKTARETTNEKIAAAKEALATDNPAIIQKKIKEYQLDSTKAFKWYKHISSIKQFSIGRSQVDYSELSAKNISITGLQAEYSNKFYVAIATGSVDYRYRDFIIRGYSPIKQYLNLVRFGIGARENTNLIFTVYQGRKQANYFTANNQAAVNKVFGITAEAKLRLDDNNYIVAEIGKSSYPNTQAVTNPINGTGNKTFNFSNHSNEAYSVQLSSRINASDTRFYGQYKHLGRNFQSFNIFNINSDFTAWQLRLDQYLWKKRLHLTASLRTNDYINPYITTNYKSNTVFKSIQATLRWRKLPTLSVGYMPSSQLTSIDNQIIENRFYTLTASANHMYRVRQRYMHTGILYTRFYNDAPDSSFIYYNARNWFIHHNIIGNTVSFNSALSLSYNTNYKLVTFDQGVNYKFNNRLSAAGGLKLNHLNNESNNLGYYCNIQMQLKKIGGFQLSFDRGFIPGITNQLRKNDFGRATYIKTF
jgi:hypothetical protein